ncbi:MAG: YifB family Mg chelatase-like AAA ATPase [Planctomycetota bacterium]|nr:YifB family Mg chelatase-like AAA ATPase [Planctomycetota bacterium]
MLSKLTTFSLRGIDAVSIEVEVDVSPISKPKTILVGLPEAAVRECVYRIDRAIVNSGYERPRDRVVINLAPAELPKQAASFDLAIAVGILVGSHQLETEKLSDYAIIGELALDGSLRSAKGALSMAIQAGKESTVRGVIVPKENAEEAAVVSSIEVIPVSSLQETVDYLRGEITIEPVPAKVDEFLEDSCVYETDFSDVRGQEFAKRAIAIAAGGGHNLLMVGPPGSGKSMLAKRIRTVMPALTTLDSIETTRIYSSMGKLPTGIPLLGTRPFRSPHHTISQAGLVGGGNPPAPGEISLSHNGVLFLDELPEFSRRTLEVLRQPLEDGSVTISRALSSTTFPADIMLIAAMNPCPCGYRTEPRRDCHCSVPQIERYRAKISGPLLDRIDVHVEVPAVHYSELSGVACGTSSAQIRSLVLKSRETQLNRYHNLRIQLNSQLNSRQIREYCELTSKGQCLLKETMAHLGLSARAYDKVLRVARTIADLENSKDINPEHLQEAVNYRVLDVPLGN